MNLLQFLPSGRALARGRALGTSLSVVACAAALTLPRAAHAEPKDAEATSLAEKAIQEDYLATRFDAAVKKLKKAVNLCKKKKCSDSVLARVHRDLATVYIAGQNKREPGKAELKKALELDPELELDESLATPELQSAFEEAGGKPKPEPPPEEPEAPLEETPPPPPPVEEDDGLRRNWVSLGVMQDFLLYSSVDFVCPDAAGRASPDYRCFAGDTFIDETRPVYDGAGNKIGGGVGIATTRILLGFDRLFGDRWLVGGRLGFAFGGGPSATDVPGFMPLHVEGRVAAYFGSSPFTSTSIRPYAALAGGFAQVRGNVPVDVYFSEADFPDQPSTVDAWRRAGNVFVSLGLGASLPIGRSMVSAEARFMELIGTSGTGFSLGLSYAYGL